MTAPSMIAMPQMPMPYAVSTGNSVIKPAAKPGETTESAAKTTGQKVPVRRDVTVAQKPAMHKPAIKPPKSDKPSSKPSIKKPVSKSTKDKPADKKKKPASKPANKKKTAAKAGKKAKKGGCCS